MLSIMFSGLLSTVGSTLSRSQVAHVGPSALLLSHPSTETPCTDESPSELVHPQVQPLRLLNLYNVPEMLQEDADAKGAPPSARSAHREAFFLSFASEARCLLQSLPSASFPTPAPTIMVTGGFRTRAGMAEAVISSATDLVGVGRPACADPALPRTLLDPSIASARSPEYAIKGSAILRWLPIKMLLPGIATIFHTILLAQVSRRQKPDYEMNIIQGAWRVWIRDLVLTGWLLPSTILAVLFALVGWYFALHL